MLFYRQNSALTTVEMSPAVIIDTVSIKNCANIRFALPKMHEINIQNIELENNFYDVRYDGAMFYSNGSDIVTVTNVTAKNHFSNIFWLDSVLTQKFLNCSFTNITIYGRYSKQIIIFSTRIQDDLDRKNTDQPVTIFQDFYVDVTFENI